MVGAALGRYREILDMIGLLRSLQTAKALGKNEKQSATKASPPNCALTTRNVVIDRMTPPV
jgi:hypothetical protein